MNDEEKRALKNIAQQIAEAWLSSREEGAERLAAYSAECERRGVEKAAVTLKAHWLVSVECLHIIHSDVAHCYCGWKTPIRANVGLAVDTWIEHVEEQATDIRREIIEEPK